jgi:hypothetical protein
VRVADMFWSLGVISNLYASSPIKFPCSAYSLSMTLAINVDFWDVGPEAIGEDMHMYLKCFFATRGKLVITTIFSPASQSNVEASGSFVRGYLDCLTARYEQGKRHLWGTLDTGYTIQKTILTSLSPASSEAILLKHAGDDNKTEKDEPRSTSGIEMKPLLHLFHRVLESHVLLSHVLFFLTAGVVLFPSEGTAARALASAFLIPLRTDIHPIVVFALQAAAWIRFFGLFGQITGFVYYEKYLNWVGFQRWGLQERALNSGSSDNGLSRTYLGELRREHGKAFEVSPENSHLSVQHLGKRASLASPRTFPISVLEWLACPVSGILYYLVPQIHVQLSHLFTDRIDYKVAAKPALKHSEATESLRAIQVAKMDYDANSESSKGDEGYFEDEEASFSVTSRNSTPISP